jgi:capsular polysaccharide biosynthesis protein
LDFRRDDVNISPAEAERHAVEPQLSSFIASIVRMLRHHLVGLAIANLASIMIAWIALTVVHTSYKSTTEILLVDPKAHIGTGEHSISAFDIDNSAINSEIELLRSRSIADVVVRQLGLARDPEFVDSGLITAKPDHEATAVDLAAGALVKRIDVQRVPFSYALTLTVTSADPAKAQRIARAVAETFLLDQQSTRQEALQRLAEWSTQRVEQLREQVAEADSAVEKVKSELGLSDGTNPTLQKLTAINADPRTYVKLKELEPLAESQHKLYEAALVQLSDVNGSERYQATTARVITPASLPEGPGAKRKLIYPAAVIFITLSFLFIVWLIEKLKGAFWTPLAVEHATGHPVLGLIPIINGAESGPPYGGRAAKRRYCAAVGSWIRCWLPRAKSLFPSTSLSDPGWQLRMLSAAAKNLGRSLRAALATRARGQMVSSMTLDSLLDMMLEEPHGGLRDAVRAGRAMSRLTDGGATKSVVSVVSAVPGEGKSATALLLATSSSLSGVRTVLLDCDFSDGPNKQRQSAFRCPRRAKPQLDSQRYALGTYHSLYRSVRFRQWQKWRSTGRSGGPVEHRVRMCSYRFAASLRRHRRCPLRCGIGSKGINGYCVGADVRNARHGGAQVVTVSGSTHCRHPPKQSRLPAVGNLWGVRLRQQVRTWQDRNCLTV